VRVFPGEGVGNGRYLSTDSRRPLFDHPWFGVGVQSTGKDVMTMMYWLLAPLALFLLGYLLFALLRAERF
jgi:K+-transporting ATPase KdpF subunit